MLRPAHVIQLCVVALLGLAVVMVHSAGADPRADAEVASRRMDVAKAEVAPAGADSAPSDLSLATAEFRSVFAGRHTIYALLAIGAMFLASRINVRKLFTTRGLGNPLHVVIVLSLVLVGLTLVPGWGRHVNGASRWLQVGPRSWGVSFQPSELLKWVMVAAVAWWCARRRGVMHKFMHGLLPIAALVAVGCAMVAVEDLGTAVLILAVAVGLLLAGGAAWWQLGLGLPIAALGAVGAILQSPYRLTRLTSFMDPWADPRGAGYHPIQSMLAFAQGGLLGRGLGHSVQKYYLPEDTTDFIFPIIAEELGVIGVALVIGLVLTILWTGLGIVRDCEDRFSRLVALGVLLTVGTQAAINLAVVTVVVPTKGIALPLVSAGGSGWVLTAFALGLLAAIDNAHHLGVDEPTQAPGGGVSTGFVGLTRSMG